MKKKFLKALAGMVVSVCCLVPLANASAFAHPTTCCGCHNSYSYYEDYDVEHPGYYTTEPVITYVHNPDEPVYDVYGNFLYYEAVPDTEVVSYEDV